jgi:hypothetical protein
MVVSGVQDVNAMNIEDNKNNLQATLTSPAIHPGEDDNQMNSADIRKIKLNYIQLNKRATTANTGNGRKIP